jgi:predicted amidohydrolase
VAQVFITVGLPFSEAKPAGVPAKVFRAKAGRVVILGSLGNPKNTTKVLAKTMKTKNLMWVTPRVYQSLASQKVKKTLKIESGVNYSMQLVALQTKINPEDYLSAASFRSRVLGLVEQAQVAGPAVIAFPEAFALPLVFWWNNPKALKAKSLLRAALGISAWSLLNPRAVFYPRALEVWSLYEAIFREAAKYAGAYIVAGSLVSPQVDLEPVQGLHLKRHVYNTSLVVAPSGQILARTHKMHLTAAERAIGLTPGNTAPVVQTKAGGLANLICLDAFYASAIEQSDSAGAWLLVQPSANNALWQGPWSGDPKRVEGQVWLEQAQQKLVGRENLQYLLNPMLTGNLYELTFEGRSGIYGPNQVLALAPSHTEEAMIKYSF